MKDYKEILYHTKEEWLAWRKNGLGGSDAAAVIGMNPYVSPYTVWANKLGLISETEDNEAMRQGRDLEAYVASRFTEKTGKKVKRKPAMLWNIKHDFMFADVDRMVVGEKAGLECKTTSSLHLKKFKNGEFPDNYYVQCMHYLAVTGLERWYLAVLILGKDFLVFEIKRDEEEIEALIQAETEFWQLVQKKEPPAVDGTPSTSETLKEIYTESKNAYLDFFGEEKQITQYLDLDRMIKNLTKEKSRIEQHMKERLGHYETGRTEGFTVSWKAQTRSTLDLKRFLEDHPEIDLEPYYKRTKFRVFQVKEM